MTDALWSPTAARIENARPIRPVPVSVARFQVGFSAGSTQVEASTRAGYALLIAMGSGYSVDAVGGWTGDDHERVSIVTEREVVDEELSYEHFAEMFAAASPKYKEDKGFVAACWIQVHGGQDQWQSRKLNAELKHLGHGISNSTAALAGNMRKKPLRVIQLKKSGGAKQASRSIRSQTRSLCVRPGHVKRRDRLIWGSRPGRVTVLPTTLRDDLLSAFNEIVTNDRERKRGSSELMAASYARPYARSARGWLDGGIYPAQAKKPSRFPGTCWAMMNTYQQVSNSRSARILIPRMMLGLCDIRNNRGVGHVGAEVDPHHMDATAVLFGSK